MHVYLSTNGARACVSVREATSASVHEKSTVHLQVQNKLLSVYARVHLHRLRPTPSGDEILSCCALRRWFPNVARMHAPECLCSGDDRDVRAGQVCYVYAYVAYDERSAVMPVAVCHL
jgi:hypothetical protein